MAHDSDAAIGGRHKPKSRETKTGAGPPRAAAELFRAVGEAIGGAAPVDTLARELGVSKREMQRICNGQNEPWEALTQKLQALVSARIRALGALYAELRARNAG
jgi:transcriptional regulator with XRE-family HTH domain